MRAAVVAGGLSLVALEAGWITTEVGRQPWIVYRVMRVEDAVTANSGIWISLTAIVVDLHGDGRGRRHGAALDGRRWRESDDVDLPTPYGPPAPEALRDTHPTRRTVPS